jgi:alanyl-tRNA synthetase
MTSKLFYIYPTITNWTTSITSVQEQNGYFLVTLRETAFYPEGGGQPSDNGTIDGIQVTEVFEQNGQIYHKIPILPSDHIVKCQIDSSLRLDHTQQHSGQHLLSAVCIELLNAETVSFHLGTDTVTIDLAVESLSQSQLVAIEERVNHYIYANVPVKTYFVSQEESKSLPFRKLLDIQEPIRVVEMEGIDLSACCGTHVARTGEIGIIKLLKTEKHRGLTRLHFKCGKRALEDYHHSHMTITKLAHHFGTNKDMLLNRLVRLEEEHKLLVKEMENLKQQLYDFEAERLLANAKNSMIINVYKDKTIKDLQAIANRIVAKENKIVILASILENRLVTIKNEAFKFHVGQLFKEQQTRFNGKGGGNERQAQITFINSDDLTAFMNWLEKEIERLITS